MSARDLTRRVEKLTGDVMRLARRQVAVLRCALLEAPAWTHDLGGGQCALIGCGDEASRAAALAALRADKPLPDGTLLLDYRPTASLFIADAVDGREHSELLVTSPRGEGKSQSVLGAMLGHAIVHKARGFAWPVRWQVVGTSRVYLTATVMRSMTADFWRGVWTLVDDDRTARLTVDGAVLVEADLVGVEDAQGVDRLRREVHCCWTDEPASAMAEQAAGITRQAWGTAVSSARLATHRRVGLLSSNAPSPRSWVWRRFVTAPEPGCAVYRIPKGERTTQEYRDMLARQLADSPDLLQRLAEGEAALPIKGLAVARGYKESESVAPSPLVPVEGRPFYVGIDAGLSPAAVICQARDGRCYVYASTTLERGGTQELVTDFLQPWLSANAPWALRAPGSLIACVDPNMRTPNQSGVSDSPEMTLRRLLPRVDVRLGPVRWAPRRDALLSCFVPGRSRLWISPVELNEDLRLGLGGAFHYRATPGGEVTGSEPVKDDASHVCDALIYVLCELWPTVDREWRRAHAAAGPERPPTKTYFRVGDASGWNRAPRGDAQHFRAGGSEWRPQ